MSTFIGNGGLQKYRVVLGQEKSSILKFLALNFLQRPILSNFSFFICHSSSTIDMHIIIMLTVFRILVFTE